MGILAIAEFDSFNVWISWKMVCCCCCCCCCPPLGEKVELKLDGIGEQVGADADPVALAARLDQRVVGDGVPITKFSRAVSLG